MSDGTLAVEESGSRRTTTSAASQKSSSPPPSSPPTHHRLVHAALSRPRRATVLSVVCGALASRRRGGPPRGNREMKRGRVTTLADLPCRAAREPSWAATAVYSTTLRVVRRKATAFVKASPSRPRPRPRAPLPCATLNQARPGSARLGVARALPVNGPTSTLHARDRALRQRQSASLRRLP